MCTLLLRVLTACILDVFTALTMEAYVNIVYHRASGCAVVGFLLLLFAFLELQILSLLSLVMSEI